MLVHLTEDFAPKRRESIPVFFEMIDFVVRDPAEHRCVKINRNLFLRLNIAGNVQVVLVFDHRLLRHKRGKMRDRLSCQNGVHDFLDMVAGKSVFAAVLIEFFRGVNDQDVTGFPMLFQNQDNSRDPCAVEAVRRQADNCLDVVVLYQLRANLFFRSASEQNAMGHKRKWERPKSDWLVFENTHEALVDQETWDIVQEVRSHKRRRTNMDEQDMFSGLVYCADCGKPMVLHRAHTMKPEQNNFTCRTYKKDGAEACTGHYIREVALTEIVLETIRRAAAFARSHPEQFAEYIQQKQSSEVAKEIKLVERELSAMKKRAGELDTVFKRMYEDSALGRVTSEQFRMLSAAYTEEKKQLAESIPEKAERLEKLRSSVANARNFIAKAKRFTDMDALTPELLHTFVAKIIVYEKEVKYSKHSPQKVRIQFRDFDLTEDTADIIEEETAKTTEKADSAIALSA